MIIEIKEGLKNRLCISMVNNLEYMLKESGCPEEYQLEINAFIDFLYLIDDKESKRLAINYAQLNKEKVYGG